MFACAHSGYHVMLMSLVFEQKHPAISVPNTKFPALCMPQYSMVSLKNSIRNFTFSKCIQLKKIHLFFTFSKINFFMLLVDTLIKLRVRSWYTILKINTTLLTLLIFSHCDKNFEFFHWKITQKIRISNFQEINFSYRNF